MKRKDFIRRIGGSLAVFGVLGPGALLNSGCRKNDKGDTPTPDPADPHADGFDRPLPIIPILTGASHQLSANENNQVEVLKGKTSVVSGYGTGILGPAIKVDTGNTVSVNLQNNLSENTTIHWHGLIIPADMDGHPMDAIPAGQNFNYVLPITQRAGTSWFHPHPMEATAKQVFKGMAGFFIINDAEEMALSLPSGDREVLLVLQDKRIQPDGSFTYNPTLWDVMTGFMGQNVLANGIEKPYLSVKTAWYRLRMVNGANARAFNLTFSDNRTFYVIGNDGGLLPAPEAVNEVMMVPGERLDILVNFAGMKKGDKVYLKSPFFQNGGSGQGNMEFTFMKFYVTEEISDSFVLPASLSTILPLDTTGATVRTFDVANEVMDAQMHHKINDIIYDMNTIHFTVPKGVTEVWEIDNSHGHEIHGVHVHDVHFQVIERTGGRGVIMPWEKGLKDVVAAFPGEKIKIALNFPTLYSGVYLMHCHNLEHEDSGMMLNFQLQ